MLRLPDAFARLHAATKADNLGSFTLFVRSTEEEGTVVATYEDLSSEPLAIMLRRDDPEFKKFVDTVLSRAMIDGEARTLYNKWFLAPIPPKGVNLGIPLSPLMRDQLSFPTDKVGDQLGG